MVFPLIISKTIILKFAIGLIALSNCSGGRESERLYELKNFHQKQKKPSGSAKAVKKEKESFQNV